MTSGIVHEQNQAKQMGCMAAFLQIFDRNQIITGKRINFTKRLPPTPVVDSELESEKTIGSPAISRELEKAHQQQGRSIPSPDLFKQSPAMELQSPFTVLKPATSLESQSKSTYPLPVFEFKEGTRASWKFCKEAPRLSLDSRTVADAKGRLKTRETHTNAAFLSANRCENDEVAAGEDIEKQRRSTSVIARLMGLEPLANPDPESAKKAELRRSASESRVSKDQYRFIDRLNFQLKQSQSLNSRINARQNPNNAAREERTVNGRQVDPKQFTVHNVRGEPSRAPQRGMRQKKSFFDSAEFFPVPKQTVSIYGEIEKRLKMRGIDKPSKDLETLKQILEALQLKGLLHPKKPSSRAINLGNFVYDESPIVVKPGPINRQGRVANDSSPSSFRTEAGQRRNLNFSGEMSPSMSPRRDRPEFDLNVRNRSSPSRGRNSISSTRSETSIKSPSRRRPLSIETQRKVNTESTYEQRRVSPSYNVRRIESDHTPNRSPRLSKPTAEICQKDDKVFTPAEDEASTISEYSISTSSQTDTERSKVEEYKEGRSLLETCDKLLHSIAELTASELQPSPVSVLDSSFYRDESSPSPVMKRSIHFKDLPLEFEDDIWSPGISSLDSKSEDDCDFIYIWDIIRTSNYLADNDSDVFSLLEKQQFLKGKDTSKVSKLQRKLIFDTINEILNRRRQLPPWKVVSYKNFNSGQASFQQIWSEFQKLRRRDTSEDLVHVICGVLKKDLAGDAINGDCPIEMSEAVLDIERQIFKDLIGETIRDLSAFSGKCISVPALPRRKLIF